MVKLRRLYGFKFMVIHHMSRVSSSIMGFCEPLSEWIFLTIQKGQKKSTLDHGKDVNMIKRTVCKYEQYVINEKCLFNRSYR